MKILVRVATTSPNAHRREVWQQRRARVERERVAVWAAWPRNHAWLSTTGKPPLPAVVTLTRISAGTLDDDNLRGALKAVRDQVAKEMGVDDADPRVTWCYGQRVGKRGGAAVEIEVVPRLPGEGTPTG